MSPTNCWEPGTTYAAASTASSRSTRSAGGSPSASAEIMRRRFEGSLCRQAERQYCAVRASVSITGSCIQPDHEPVTFRPTINCYGWPPPSGTGIVMSAPPGTT